MSGPGETLFAFVRHWSRRTQRGRDVLVTEAVSALGSATINAVAHELGIDQSGASRMVRDAIEAGYLTMSRSAADARRREVTVTPAGEDLLTGAHRWQEETFARLTASWSASERTDFHRAMLRLMASSRASEI